MQAALAPVRILNLAGLKLAGRLSQAGGLNDQAV
jgi:hypothetical protein